jgi:hypothetical protein
VKRLFLKYNLILFGGYFIQWILFSKFNPGLPEKIGTTNISLPGLTLVIFQITVLILFQQTILHHEPKTNILNLIVSCFLVFLLGEGLFQLARLIIEKETPFQSFHSFLGIFIRYTIFGLFISFCISIQLKTRKTWIVVIAILVFLFFFAIEFVH